MKTFLFVLALSIFTNSNIFSQQVIVNGFNINQDGITYVEMELKRKPFSTYYWVNINFGQEQGLLAEKSRLQKSSGQGDMLFNSKINVLNYMSKNGWEYIGEVTKASKILPGGIWLMRKVD